MSAVRNRVPRSYERLHRVRHRFCSRPLLLLFGVVISHLDFALPQLRRLANAGFFHALGIEALLRAARVCRGR